MGPTGTVSLVSYDVMVQYEYRCEANPTGLTLRKHLPIGVITQQSTLCIHVFAAKMESQCQLTTCGAKR
jgi:hypothetical protein